MEILTSLVRLRTKLTNTVRRAMGALVSFEDKAMDTHSYILVGGAVIILVAWCIIFGMLIEAAGL